MEPSGPARIHQGHFDEMQIASPLQSLRTPMPSLPHARESNNLSGSNAVIGQLGQSQAIDPGEPYAHPPFESYGA